MATRKKAAKAKKPAKPKKPPVFHEQAGAGSAGKAQPVGGAGMSAGVGVGSAVLELVASDVAGLSAVVLELAGEGKLSLSSALSAWQHEQDRVSNRVWRRPGGLARMGGL
jgi:hypothetical protein